MQQTQIQNKRQPSIKTSGQKIPKDIEKEIQDAFELYDVEQKGVIGRVETRNIMGNFGFNQLNAREIEEVLKAQDAIWQVEHKNSYNFQNIMDILNKQWNKQNGKMAEWEQIFQVFDIKGKECIGVNEIKKVFDEFLDEKYIEDEDIIEYIKEFDQDQDGRIIYFRIFRQKRIYEFVYVKLYYYYNIINLRSYDFINQ